LPDLATAHRRAVDLAYGIHTQFVVPGDWRIEVVEESGRAPLAVLSASIQSGSHG